MAETLHQIARFLVPTWPLLAACLIALMPEAQAGRSARLFAMAGLVLTAILDPFLSGQDILARWACLLAGCVPFLSWQAREKRLASVSVFWRVPRSCWPSACIRCCPSHA
ncbi:hypothetical protein [Asaia platycodi]|uniref:hypothetical protein n=1 Tax=Asaia platycodi TaxID=610243 RepID=UPI00047038BB|nr:hypothetical protein [Asaia platycodi]